MSKSCSVVALQGKQTVTKSFSFQIKELNIETSNKKLRIGREKTGKTESLYVYVSVTPACITQSLL